jgi:hypothetical protein
MRQLGPSVTFRKMTACGPISTLSPMTAPVSITAVGWMLAIAVPPELL